MEIFVRGTAVYWFLFLMFRFVLRRDVGSFAITDVLLVVLIADASQNAMAGGYDTVAEGFVLVGTIAGWNYALDWVAWRFSFLRFLVEGNPVVLVDAGKLNRRNMRRELMSREELMGALREHGVERIEDVKRATMETSGQISVIAYAEGEKKPQDGPSKRPF